MATVSSHILDSIVGSSADGIRVELFRLGASGDRQRLFEVTADEDGRISVAVDIDPDDRDARYELLFHSADYFKDAALPRADQQIIDVVVVRMAMPDPDKRYHIPLVLSPHAYTIWWSS